MKRYIFSTLLAAFLIGFGGCGGSSGGTSGDMNNVNNGGNGGGQNAISKEQMVKNSFAAVGNAVDASGIVDNINPEDFTSSNPNTRALTDVTSGTRNCTLDGNVTYTVQTDVETNPVKSVITLTFAQCSQEANLVYNGSITFTSQLDTTIQLHDFKMEDDGDISRFGDMTILVHQLGDNVRMRFDGDMTKARSDLQMQHRFELTHFVIDKDAADTLAIDGSLALQSTPVTCADGTYDVNTTERLVLNSDGDPIDGTVIINDVTYDFNSDRTVTATVNGETVTFDPDQVDDDINCTVVTQ